MSILYNIYYCFSSLWFSLFINHIGKHMQLHFKGRVIGGKYVSIEENIKFDKNWLLAVCPHYAGKDNPIKNNGKGIVIGSGTTANRNFTVYCSDSVQIGANCMFGGNVLVTDNNHGTNLAIPQPYNKQPLTCKETVIEDNCWVAQNVSVLAGSHIGKNCIIGANSVVTGTIPSFSMAAGIPAKVIKKWDISKECWESV